MKYFRNLAWLLGAVMLFSLPPAMAQESSKATKAQKKAERKKEQKLAKSRKAGLKGKQRHHKLQDKKTRKKMKRHRKRVNRHYPGDKPGFFRRIFRKKHYYIFVPPVNQHQPLHVMHKFQEGKQFRLLVFYNGAG